MKNLFYILGSISLIVVGLVYAGFILKPITLGLLIALLVHPSVVFLSKYLKWHSISFLAVVIAFIAVVGSLMTLISYQLVSLFDDIRSDRFSIDNFRLSVESFLRDLGIAIPQLNDLISNGISRLVAVGTETLGLVISSSTSLLFTALLGLVFSYFFSAHYHGLRDAFLKIFDSDTQAKIGKILNQSPGIIRQYLKGMSLVMLTLAVLNTLVYFLIGVNYALVWGVITGLLAFIPYLGSFIALLLPLSYSIIETGSVSQPLLILLAFTIIQQIEGNLLTPKIVGDAVNVNPLAAILFMIISGRIWGVYGVFISIMMAGILKMALEQWKDYKPIAKIMSEEVTN